MGSGDGNKYYKYGGDRKKYYFIGCGEEEFPQEKSSWKGNLLDHSVCPRKESNSGSVYLWATLSDSDRCSQVPRIELRSFMRRNARALPRVLHLLWGHFIVSFVNRVGPWQTNERLDHNHSRVGFIHNWGRRTAVWIKYLYIVERLKSPHHRCVAREIWSNGGFISLRVWERTDPFECGVFSGIFSNISSHVTIIQLCSMRVVAAHFIVTEIYKLLRNRKLSGIQWLLDHCWRGLHLNSPSSSHPSMPLQSR